MDNVERRARELYEVHLKANHKKLFDVGMIDEWSSLARHVLKQERISVLRELKKCANDCLYALDEISLETDPIGATNGFIEAWKEYDADLTRQLEKLEEEK